MLMTTTPILEGKTIIKHHGIVFGETVHGINALKDFAAGVRNFVGGRVSGYESEVIEAREEVLREMSARAEAMGANAIIGISFNLIGMGQGGNMLLLEAQGTAVTIED